MNVSTYVPILRVNGTNYRQWAAQMQAFLQANGLWKIVNGTATHPMNAADGAEWDVYDDMAHGNIILRLSHNVRNEVGVTSAKTWTNLATAFGSVGFSHIYGDFRTLLKFKISGGQHPAAEITRFFTLLECLKANGVALPDNVQGMMLLNALPARWDHVSAIYLQGKSKVDEIKFMEVQQAIIAEFDRTGRGSGQHVINAKKRKGEHPRY